MRRGRSVRAYGSRLANCLLHSRVRHIKLDAPPQDSDYMMTNLTDCQVDVGPTQEYLYSGASHETCKGTTNAILSASLGPRRERL
jgi:hypothetical protein